ncbi:MAG: transketolase C-terminal domain-containing protein [Thermoleophilia bacterium]
MIEFLEGNDAVVRAALDAGCTFYAGYPITPATSILTGMMRALPEGGGVAVQCEDEIASIGMCIGAAMTGQKCLTATSGPGMSLYSENLGLAQMGETPLVIVDVQRQGPATGSATKGADGDILFLRWGTSGGLPLIVLSPESVQECYTLTRAAFDLAERYRTPVILASQTEVGLTRERVDLEAAAASCPPPLSRALAPAEGPYAPHAFSHPAEVGPLSPIGGPHLVRYTTSMHDERAFLTADSEVIARMMEHLERKILDHQDEIARVDWDPQEGATTLILAYGVAARSAREAAARVRAQGGRVSLLVLKTLFPVPEAAIGAALAGIERVVVPEMNLGQYVQVVRALAPGLEVRSVGQMNTELLSPDRLIREGGLL